MQRTEILSNHRRFFDTLSKKLNVKTYSDWYTVSQSKVLKNGGKLVLFYHGSLAEALKNVYPEHPFISLNFERQPRTKLSPGQFGEDTVVNILWQFSRKDQIPLEHWNDLSNQKQFTDSLKTVLNYREHEDWYLTLPHHFEYHGGKDLLVLYDMSPALCLSLLYPNENWKLWKFDTTALPSGYFTQKKHLRQFFNELKNDLNIRTWKDWLNLKKIDILSRGGRGFLNAYNDSINNILVDAIPDLDLESWRILSNDGIQGHFSSLDNQRIFMDRLYNHLKLKDWKDWYRVRSVDVDDRGGKRLTRIYGSSMPKIVTAIYPEHSWETESFSRFEETRWKDPTYQRTFADQLATKLKLNTWEDWYQVDPLKVIEMGGQSLLTSFEYSMVRMLTRIYPEHHWDYLKFPQIVQARQLLDQVGRNIGVATYEDWYHVRYEDVVVAAGAALKHFGSFYKMIQGVYPEHPWKFWKFDRAPDKAWESDDNIREFLGWILVERNFSSIDELRNLTKADVAKLGGASLIAQAGGWNVLLDRMFPDFQWAPVAEKKLQFVSKAQRELLDAVTQIFSAQGARDMFVSFLHPDLKYTQSQKPIELDIYIPSLNLAFEYQGQQHYDREKNQLFRITYDRELVLRDEEKKLLCESAGLTLVRVPFWWNGKKESIISTVLQLRPDVAKVIKIQT